MKLSIDQLSKSYGGQKVLKDLSLHLENVSKLALIGASGSGKSTLLRLIAGLEDFESGSLSVNGRNLKETQLEAYRKQVGFVFQDHNLFNHLSVLENILLVLEKVHKRPRETVIDDVSSLLEQFGLYAHKDKKPHQISGGQSQRVSIVRALAIEPEIVLLDEPTSSLDPVLTYEVLTAIETLAKANKDFVIVTHELGFARKIADYVIFMQDGAILEHGDPGILLAPQTPELKALVSKVLNFNDI